jgi:hypothetical protein
VAANAREREEELTFTGAANVGTVQDRDRWILGARHERSANIALAIGLHGDLDGSIPSRFDQDIGIHVDRIDRSIRPPIGRRFCVESDVDRIDRRFSASVRRAVGIHADRIDRDIRHHVDPEVGIYSRHIA